MRKVMNKYSLKCYVSLVTVYFGFKDSTLNRTDVLLYFGTPTKSEISKHLAKVIPDTIISSKKVSICDIDRKKLNIDIEEKDFEKTIEQLILEKVKSEGIQHSGAYYI